MNVLPLFSGSLNKLNLLSFCTLLILSSCKNLSVEEPSNPLENRIALNAYSFNTPLRDGSMDLFDLLEFCSEENIDAADLTGYYFPGYPEVPDDEYIYRIKNRAYELGVDICGTGVRNDFSIPDEKLREEEKDLVKEWIVVAEKLGAPSLRIFTGKEVPEGYSWNQAAEWIAEDIYDFGFQNHLVELIPGDKRGILQVALTSSTAFPNSYNLQSS